MLKYNCLITALLLASIAWCRPGDTMNYYRLKGIDVSAGRMFNYMGERTNVNLLKAISSQEYSDRYDYDNALSKSEDVHIDPFKVGLGIVFGNNKRNNQYFINKHEVLFRLSFETIHINRAYNIELPLKVNPDYKVPANFKYTYQTQTVGLGYQLSTKSFLKYLALFGGLTADFGMATFKHIEETGYTNFVANDIEKYNTTLLRGNAILGLKYNFSCDYNFFLQGEFGVLHFGKDIGTNATYCGLIIGIRYKFLEDQDRLRYNNKVFW